LLILLLTVVFSWIVTLILAFMPKITDMHKRNKRTGK
jgi:hypothetical protein